MANHTGVTVLLISIAACFAPVRSDAQGQGVTPEQRAEIMKRADTNQDGRITFEELKVVNPNMNEQLFSRIDRDGDGAVTMADGRREAGQRESQQSGLPKFGAQAAEQLLGADANNDGKVSYREIVDKKPGYPKANFDRWDTNRDGFVANDDVAALRERLAKADGAATDPNARERRSERERPSMRSLLQSDANGDGGITYDEARSALPELTQAMFARMDRNGDGKVSRDDRR